MGDLADKVARGFCWTLLAKFGNQAVNFAVTLVLARLLLPEDFGTVAILTVFVSLSGVLVDSGFPKALVQKKDATQADFSTAFYISLSASLAVYALLFAGAPFLARFYGDAALIPLMRVLAVTVFFNALNGVQNAELLRQMLFKLDFRISWVSTCAAAAAGIALALGGQGAWALVWSQVAGGVVGCVMRQCVIAWRPTCEFSLASARSLFSFGWKNAVTSLVNDAYRDLYSLVIGRLYSRAALAFFNRAERVPQLVNRGVNGTLMRVAFPALARLQTDIPRLREALLRLVRLSTFCIFPLLVTFIVTADAVILLLFGEKWLPAVPYLRLACAAQLFTSVSGVNEQATVALGRSDRQLAGTLLTRLVSVLNLVFVLPQGLMPFLAADAAVVNPLRLFVTILLNRRLVGCGFVRQLANLLPGLAASGLLAFFLWALDAALPLGPFLRFPLVAAAGVLFYALASYLLNRATVCEAVRLAVRLLKGAR